MHASNKRRSLLPRLVRVHAVLAPIPDARAARQAFSRPPTTCLQVRFATDSKDEIDQYFVNKPFRRVLWSFISGFSGIYIANTITLSFGALAVNDIAAAAASLLFYEVVSRQFYGSLPNACAPGRERQLRLRDQPHAP